jgi:hypothetical protein
MFDSLFKDGKVQEYNHENIPLSPKLTLLVPQISPSRFGSPNGSPGDSLDDEEVIISSYIMLVHIFLIYSFIQIVFLFK